MPRRPYVEDRGVNKIDTGYYSMGIAPTRSYKVRLPADDRRVERYIIAAVIIVAAATLALIMACNTYISSGVGIRIGFVHFEKIEFRSASVIKSDHTYAVTINFYNAGDIPTSIDSVLLNGVPYDDPSWKGTVKPSVSGDISLKTVINAGVLYNGMVKLGDDCREPMGDALSGQLIITIHSTGGEDYDVVVALPGGAAASDPEAHPLSTFLTLSLPPTAIQFIPVNLKATLKDERGIPIQGAKIRFRFGGGGIFTETKILTDADGTVPFTYRAIDSTEILWVIFDGMEGYAGSMAMGALYVQPIMPYIVVVVIAGAILVVEHDYHVIKTLLGKWKRGRTRLTGKGR